MQLIWQSSTVGLLICQVVITMQKQTTQKVFVFMPIFLWQSKKHVMNIGIGLGVFPILSIILNTINIPLTWYVFLILAFIVPAIDLFGFLRDGSQAAKKEKIKKTVKLTKTNLALVIVFIYSSEYL